MGCGTGPLATANQAYSVTLTFDGGAIKKTDPIYVHFKSALDWLIQGVLAVGGSGYSEENISGLDVTSIDVFVQGPLLQPHTAEFNRAFNRLLWGVKYRRGSGPTPPPVPPVPSGRSVTPSKQNWPDETT